MKKTPKWFKPNFDIEKRSNDHSNGIPVNSKNRKTNVKKALNLGKVDKNLNLIDKLIPASVSDLIVHSKKVSEVENWLNDHVLHADKVSILLLTGPTGVGKTATVRVLCKTLNIKIIEWINPIDSSDIEEIRGPGQTAKFTEFLIQSSRYPSLLMHNQNKQIILVEDFPNSIVHNPNDFESILELLATNGKYSSIFICTDTKDNKLNLSQFLFPDQTILKYSITTISFNSVNATLMKQGLKRMNNLIEEKYCDLYKKINNDTIDTIVNSSMGDFRTAMNYFNFACIKGAANLPSIINEAQTTGTKRKRKEKDKETLTNMSKDEALGLFHGVGRVLNPKRVNLPENQWKFERDPEKIVDQFITIPNIFVSFLQENYLRYFGDFNDAKNGAEILGFAELLLMNWKDDHVTTCGLWIVILGLMVHNKHVISKWNPVQGPKHHKYNYKNQFYENKKMDPLDVGYLNIIKPNYYVSSTSSRFCKI